MLCLSEIRKFVWNFETTAKWYNGNKFKFSVMWIWCGKKNPTGGLVTRWLAILKNSLIGMLFIAARKRKMHLSFWLVCCLQWAWIGSQRPSSNSILIPSSASWHCKHKHTHSQLCYWMTSKRIMQFSFISL